MTKDEAIERLREWFSRAVYTVLRHQSRSGMQRTIGVVAIGNRGVDGYLPIRHLNVTTAEVFEIAYRVATGCYSDGYALRHEWI